MEILEVGAAEYDRVVELPYHVFGSAAFNDLNREKTEEVFYLLFREGKFRLGIVGGKKEHGFLSPFSAPFGGFSSVSSNIRIQYIEEAVRLLTAWAGEKDFNSVSITLPPSFYDDAFISKQVNCLWRLGFQFLKVDLNYSFSLHDFDDHYTGKIWYNARKNLNIAMENDLQFISCNTPEERAEAYQIIQKNRESRGFPLRMTWDQVLDTTQTVPADFFIVRDVPGNSIASAIVFHVAPGIVQVIYWGDLHEYGKLKTMNFLSYRVFEHYHQQGMKRVDLGPSTDHSVPNYGLAEFKESIGCTIDPKFTFTRDLD